MVVITAPWPWSLLNVGSGLVTVAAIVVAWKSADRVVRKNRGWTRAWRISVCAIAVGLGGIWVPIGAAYILIQYRSQASRRRATPRSSQATPNCRSGTRSWWARPSGGGGIDS